MSNLNKDKFKEIAKQYAEPHLQKEGVERVFVNQNGLIWINNELEQMAAYFASKGEIYEVFENITAEEVKPKKTKKPTE